MSRCNTTLFYMISKNKGYEMSDIKRLKDLYKLLRKVDKKMLAIRNKATDDKMLADAMEVCGLANVSIVSFVGDLIEEREN